ncbi:MAG: hypothetical protein ACI9UO_000745 [Nitrospinales bacterium]|jgi:hypothetical protein
MVNNSESLMCMARSEYSKEVKRLNKIEVALEAAPDKQISLTAPINTIFLHFLVDLKF